MGVRQVLIPIPSCCQPRPHRHRLALGRNSGFRPRWGLHLFSHAALNRRLTKSSLHVLAYHCIRSWGANFGIGRLSRVGGRSRGGHFGKNVTFIGPRGQILDHRSSLLYPSQIRGKLAASVSRKRAQPNLVTCLAPRDSLPRPVERHVIPAKAGIHLVG